MAKTKAEQENPFRRALANVGMLSKSAPVVDEDDDDEELAELPELDDDDDFFAAAAADDDEDDDDEAIDGDDDEDDDDDDELFDFTYEDDDDDDEVDDDDDEEVEKSDQSQSAAITAADEKEAAGKVKRARRKRASGKNLPEEPARKARDKGVNKRTTSTDDDGEDDFKDEDDGDEGTADYEGDDPQAPNSADNNRRRGRYAKSEEDTDEEDDFGESEVQQEFIDSILRSEYAKNIDSTDALKFLAKSFAAELANERANSQSMIQEMNKSLEGLADVYDELKYLRYAVGVISDGVTRVLENDSTLAQGQELVTKSLETITSDVGLIKSQPTGAVSPGVTRLPARPVNEPIKRGDVTIRPHDIHVALEKAVNNQEMTADNASQLMAMIDSPGRGIEAVLELLPKNVREGVLSKSA
jgi:hypothetical protein